MTACCSTFFGGNGHVRKVTLSPSFGTNSPSMLKGESKEKISHTRKQLSVGIVDMVFYSNAVQSTRFLDINAQIVHFICYSFWLNSIIYIFKIMQSYLSNVLITFYSLRYMHKNILSAIVRCDKTMTFVPTEILANSCLLWRF